MEPITKIAPPAPVVITPPPPPPTQTNTPTTTPDPEPECNPYPLVEEVEWVQIFEFMPFYYDPAIGASEEQLDGLRDGLLEAREVAPALTLEMFNTIPATIFPGNHNSQASVSRGDDDTFCHKRHIIFNTFPLSATNPRREHVAPLVSTVVLHEYTHQAHELIKDINPAADNELELLYQTALTQFPDNHGYWATNRNEFLAEVIEQFTTLGKQDNFEARLINEVEGLAAWVNENLGADIVPVSYTPEYHNIIGDSGIKVYQFDTFWAESDNHGDRVYERFTKNVTVDAIVHQVHAPYFEDAYDYIFAQDEVSVITQSAHNRVNEDQYDQSVIDRVDAFANSNVLWFNAMENSGDDAQDYTHGVYSYEILTSGKGLDRFVSIASYTVRADGNGIIGNLDLDHYELYKDEIIFFEESSTSYATPIAAAIGTNLLAEGYTPQEVKQIILDRTVERELQFLSNGEWINMTVKIYE